MSLMEDSLSCSIRTQHNTKGRQTASLYTIGHTCPLQFSRRGRIQNCYVYELPLNSDKTLHSYIPSGLNTCCLGSSLWGTDATEEVLLNLFAAIAAACLNSKWSVSISWWVRGSSYGTQQKAHSFILFNNQKARDNPSLNMKTAKLR
jgi:hypothetical protein